MLRCFLASCIRPSFLIANHKHSSNATDEGFFCFGSFSMALCSSEDSVIAMAVMGSLDRNYGTDRLVNGAIRSSSCYCTFHDTIAFDISDIQYFKVPSSSNKYASRLCRVVACDTDREL